MTVLVSTRGPKNGRCNICGELGKLTEDHTPPKGCIKIGAVELRHIVDHLTVEKSTKKGRISQNGVKYRTLCHRCNNEYLGLNYDPSFIEFVNSIGDYLKSVLHLPPVASIKAKPQRIMRALLGHICAQGVNRYLKGPMTEPIRDYFLDETLPLPQELEIYCWPFPSKQHVMARDCGYLDTRVGDSMAIWFLKFFPVGFLVTFNEPTSYNFNLPCLSGYRNIHIDHEVDILMDTRTIPPEYWPEAPPEHSVIVYGQEAITSYDWKKLSR